MTSVKDCKTSLNLPDDLLLNHKKFNEMDVEESGC